MEDMPTEEKGSDGSFNLLHNQMGDVQQEMHLWDERSIWVKPNKGCMVLSQK